MSRDRPGAIVIGADYRGLGVVRALGRRGVRVWVLADEHRLAACSRYCERSLVWRTQDEPEDTLVARLNELGAAHGLDGWTLIPTDDRIAALVARNREALARFRLSILVGWDTLRWAYDKRLTYQLAREAGVAHPITAHGDPAAYDGPFPAILKPAFSPAANALTVAKAWPVRDRPSLLARYDEASALLDPELIMIQELIAGDGREQLSFGALCRDGEPLAWVVARRTRQWPMDFGRASTFVETIDDRAVEDAARRVLGRLGFSGIIEIEFKRDPRDGVPKLLDINPRFWGWHTLGERAGVDFSHLLWRMLEGDDIAPVRGRSGVRWVRGLTDAPVALGEIRSGRLRPGAYLMSLRPPIARAVLALDDPLPALVEVPLAIRMTWQRRRDTPRAAESATT